MVEMKGLKDILRIKSGTNVRIKIVRPLSIKTGFKKIRNINIKNNNNKNKTKQKITTPIPEVNIITSVKILTLWLKQNCIHSS